MVKIGAKTNVVGEHGLWVEGFICFPIRVLLFEALPVLEVAGYYHFKGNGGTTKAFEMIIRAVVLGGGRNRLKEFLGFYKTFKIAIFKLSFHRF